MQGLEDHRLSFTSYELFNGRIKGIGNLLNAYGICSLDGHFCPIALVNMLTVMVKTEPLNTSHKLPLMILWSNFVKTKSHFISNGCKSPSTLMAFAPYKAFLVPYSCPTY